MIIQGPRLIVYSRLFRNYSSYEIEIYGFFKTQPADLKTEIKTLFKTSVKPEMTFIFIFLMKTPLFIASIASLVNSQRKMYSGTIVLKLILTQLERKNNLPRCTVYSRLCSKLFKL